MGSNTHRYNRFKGYTAKDCDCKYCDCKYCLHYGGKKKGCLIPVCCCLEERIRAGCDLTKGADGYRHIPGSSQSPRISTPL